MFLELTYIGSVGWPVKCALNLTSHPKLVDVGHVP